MRAAPEDNIFGKILKNELPSHEVYSNEHVYCFLDIFPQALGHTLVIPRNFSENVLVADEADILHCLQAVRLLMPAIKAATGAKGISVVTNTGREAGQMIEYLHFHLVPRYAGDSVSLSEIGPEQEAEALKDMAARIRAKVQG